MSTRNCAFVPLVDAADSPNLNADFDAVVRDHCHTCALSPLAMVLPFVAAVMLESAALGPEELPVPPFATGSTPCTCVCKLTLVCPNARPDSINNERISFFIFNP